MISYRRYKSQAIPLEVDLLGGCGGGYSVLKGSVEDLEVTKTGKRGPPD